MLNKKLYKDLILESLQALEEETAGTIVHDSINDRIDDYLILQS